MNPARSPDSPRPTGGVPGASIVCYQATREHNILGSRSWGAVHENDILASGIRNGIGGGGTGSNKRGSEPVTQPSLARHAARSARPRLLLAVLVSALGACGDVRRDSLENAAALHAAVKAISNQLHILGSDTAAAGDRGLGDRIEQAATDIERLLPALDTAMRGAAEDGDAVVRSVSRELAAGLATLRSDGVKVGAYASATLNSSLALISQVLNGLAGTDLPPTILAISPSRLDARQQSRRIKIFGHLPGEPNEDVVVSVGGKPVPVSRTPANGVAFTVPEDLMLTEEQLVPLRVRVRQRSGLLGLSSETIDFEEHLVVGKQTPFSCAIESYEEHPEYLEKIVADQAVSYEVATAGGTRRASENRRVPAAELFVAAVKDAAAYDPRTAVVVAAGEKLFADGGGCGQGPSASARIVESGGAVDIHLNAPHLARRVRIDGWKIQMCDEADTRIAMTLKPTFLAARRDRGALTLTKKETIDVGFSGANALHGLADGTPSAVHVTCKFADGAEQWDTRTMVLTRENREAAARGIGARVAQDRVVLEPFDPLRFDDQLP